MLMRKIRDVSESEKDTIINKIIIIECTDKLLEFYNDKEISEDKIKANIEEIENGLNCDNLDKRQLYGIAKILI